ncbi:MAG: binding domain, excisionase family [Nocardioidaceae bacterium]|nr:binding domain, excisionase family [Nocardioidaceae bacterium]
MRFNAAVPRYRVAEAAEILGVSDDTVRRWIDTGRLSATEEDHVIVVPGADLARLALSQAVELDRTRSRAEAVSARNRLPGIVTAVRTDGVMAQVEMMCGRYRITSLMSRDAADELGLEPGVRAIASVKSTNVIVERP